MLQQIEQQLGAGHTLSPEGDNALTTWSQVLELLPPNSPSAKQALASFAEHTRRNAESKQAAGDAIAASDYFVFSDQATKLLGIESADAAPPSRPVDGSADPALTEAMSKDNAALAQEANRNAPPATGNNPTAQADATEPRPEPAPQQAETAPTPTQADHAGDAPAEPPRQAEAATAAPATDNAAPSAEPAPQQADAATATTHADDPGPAAAPTPQQQPEVAQADHAVPPPEPAPQQAEAPPATPQPDHAAPSPEPAPQQAEAAPQPDRAAPPPQPAQQAEAAPTTQPDRAAPLVEPARQQQPEATPADRGFASMATKPRPDQAASAPMQIARGDMGTATGERSTSDAGAGHPARADVPLSAPMPSMTPGLPAPERRTEQESAAAAAFASRGDAMVALKDISAARKFYQYAANAGSAKAATALGETYDPAFLSHLGTVGLKPDVAMAASWYRKAAALGDRAADRRLQALALGPAK